MLTAKVDYYWSCPIGGKTVFSKIHFYEQLLELAPGKKRNYLATLFDMKCQMIDTSLMEAQLFFHSTYC